MSALSIYVKHIALTTPGAVEALIGALTVLCGQDTAQHHPNIGKTP